MQREFNTLLIPVESQVRELDGKLLLACSAANRGFHCILGSRAQLHYHASKVKNAVYLAKSMRRFSHRMFKILHGLGHRIVAWDEEALVRLPDEEYYTHRLSPTTFNYIDHLFCWGESNAQLFQQYAHYQNQPLHTSGNPRIDMLRPELNNYFAPEKNTLIEKYGDYVLINTNFGQVNHFIPDVGTHEATRDRNFSKAEDNGFISQRYTHKQSLFSSFKQLIPYLANTFPDLHFILRPHPSESVTAWEHHLIDCKNVSVNNQGNVIPWIMGARALVSNGCTTSIEASILQIPTLGYYPLMNDKIDDKLPKLLCTNAQSNDALAETISQVIGGRYTPKQDARDILGEHISSLDGDFAYTKIIDTLDKHYSQTNYKRQTVFNSAPSIIHNKARTIVKRIKSRKASSRNSSAYHLHRFPPLSLHEVNEKISRFNALTGDFSNIKARTIADDLFSISS